MSTARVLLSLGSNLSCKAAEAVIQEIRLQLSALFREVRFSSVYQTPNESDGGREPYMNCVAIGETELSLAELEAKCKSMEIRFGRTLATRKAGVVPIDVDIVRYGSETVRPQNLEMSYMRIGMEELEMT